MKRLAVLCCAVLLAAFPLRAAELNSSSTLNDLQPPQSQPLPTADVRFVPGIDDLPLMPGLEPIPDQETIFITHSGGGSGRIAQSTVQGMVDVDDVYKFYRHSLPQLGWQVASGKTFTRAGETLRIDAHGDGKVTTVRYSINPQ